MRSCHDLYNGHLLAAQQRWEHIVDRFDLSGAIALITGSSRGIGRTLAAGLADAGARIVLNGKRTAGLEEAVAGFREQYGADRVYARAFDVTEALQVAAAVDWIEDEVGPIRILINNAGIQHRVPLPELDEANWAQVLRVNLTGAFLVGREVAHHMITRGRGKIINIASVQSELARPTIAAYTTAKGGLRNLTRAMTASGQRPACRSMRSRRATSTPR